MNWFVFALTTWIVLGLQLGVADMLRLGPGSIAPSFVLPLVVFVALSAPHVVALWAALVLGVLTDLTHPVALAGGQGVVTLVGPHALGALLASHFVLTIRSLLLHRNPVTFGVLAAVASLIAQIVVVFLFAVRVLYDDAIVFPPAAELLSRVIASALTGLVAMVMSLVLLPLTGAFRFPHAGRRA